MLREESPCHGDWLRVAENDLTQVGHYEQQTRLL
jgi:hypothetical protein